MRTGDRLRTGVNGSINFPGRNLMVIPRIPDVTATDEVYVLNIN